MDIIISDLPCQGFQDRLSNGLTVCYNNKIKQMSMIYPYEKVLPFEYENSESDDSRLIERPKTLGPLHSALCNGIEFTGKNQFPIVEPYTGQLPEVLCSVHRLLGKPDSLLRDQGGHFFTSDSHIEPFWKYPFRYIQWLRKLGYVVSTDFSLYTNMLLMQKLWNSFRNKLMTAFFQHNGLNAIPAPSWGDLANLELYMEGWPKESIIAINSTGIGLDKRCRYIWLEGYHTMLDILKPIHIIRYGAYIEGERKEMSTYYPNNNKPGYRYGR